MRAVLIMSYAEGGSELPISAVSAINERAERVLITPRPALTTSGRNPPMASPKLCAVTGCIKPKHSGYFCSTHAWRFKHHGCTDKPIRPPRPIHCSIVGCSRERAIGRKGWCEAHYQKWRKRGDPLAPRLIAPHGEPKRWLLAHVDYAGEECLSWPFARHSNGEAAIGDRQSRQAARLMCILAHGDPPTPAHQAAHGCGKGHLACVNPRHLRWATPKENTADQVIHGTRPLGGRHSFAKLSELQVRAIRNLATAFSVSDLAEIFGVHAWTITDVIQRKTWAWLE
jgi:hypothetical protein